MSKAQTFNNPPMDKLTGGGLLARNVIFNLIGRGAPLIAAVFAIPFLIKGLGTDRFGVLTLVWLVMGYFSLLDLGLGRAMTQLVSIKLGAGLHQEIRPVVWTALLMTIIMGLLGALGLSLLAPWLVRTVLKIPSGLQGETLIVFYLMASSLPLVISSASLRGILEAYQRFGLINAVGGVMGVYSFLAPLLALSFSRRLPVIAAFLLAGRIISWVANLLLCFHAIPFMRHRICFKYSLLKPLIRFGSWMTISNIVSPLMQYLDRFLISALVSVAAVAYYATPYEMVTRLWLIPGALMGVLFPAFSASFFEDRNRAQQLFQRGVKCVFLIMFPLTLVIVTFAHEGLQLWLGGDFSEKSARVLQFLAVGVFINSLAFSPFALLQGAGRPDITAKLHLIELPFYLVATVWAIKTYGIEGAAITWTIRGTVDAALLFFFAQMKLASEKSVLRNLSLALGAVLLTLGLSTLLTGMPTKLAFLSLAFLSFIAMGWFLILNRAERDLMHNRLKVLLSRNL